MSPPIMASMKDHAGPSAAGGKEERILVVSNRYVGDCLLAIPFLRNLRRAYPDAVIDLVASGGGRVVLANCPYLDEIVTLTRDERLPAPAQLRADAARLASRGYVLETGRVTLTGSGKDLAGDRRVRDAYLGEG